MMFIYISKIKDKLKPSVFIVIVITIISCFTINEVYAISVRHDVNQDGIINTIDAMLVMRKSLGLPMNETSWHAVSDVGDVNCDGVSDTTDSMLLLKYSIGFDVEEISQCNSPIVSNVRILGNPELGETLTLEYDFYDIDGDDEGNSIIVWSTEHEELQRSFQKTFIVPEGYDGDMVTAWVYPVDDKGVKSSVKYESDDKVRLVYGDVFFVDSTNGNDSNNGRSEEHAWRTIDHTRREINSGNVPDGSNILFKRGEIFNDSYFSVSLSGDKINYNPVVIGAYGDENDEKPIFANAATLYWNENLAEHIIIEDIKFYKASIAFSRKNLKDVTISRVDIDSASHNGLYLESIDGYVIEDCSITNAGFSGILIYATDGNKASNGWIGITNGIIRNNIIDTTDEIYGDGITLHRADDGSKNDIGSNHIIENNTVSNCGENSFDITSGENIIVRNNIGYNSKQPNLLMKNVENVQIYGNYFYDSYSGICFEQPSKNTFIHNNIIENSTKRSIYFSHEHPDEGIYSVNTKIYNNTIMHTSNYEAFRLSSEVDGVEFKNNIVYISDENQNLVYYSAGETFANINASFSNNLISGHNNSEYFAMSTFSNNSVNERYTFEQWQSAALQGLNTLLSSPSWMDILNKNYHLKSDSVAIDAGASVGVTYDYDGNIRDSVLDIGAFEYISN